MILSSANSNARECGVIYRRKGVDLLGWNLAPLPWGWRTMLSISGSKMVHARSASSSRNVWQVVLLAMPWERHRHRQINTPAKGDISTLPGRRHFYFAATMPGIAL